MLFRSGGGIAGYAVLALLSQAIGRPAAFVVACLTGLAGILLTFDITLHELFSSLRDSFARFWATVWNPGQKRSGEASVPAMRQPATDKNAATNDVPLPQSGGDDIVPTPIAERPTRASLFQRPETRARRTSAQQPTAEPAPKAEPGNAAPGNTKLLTSLLTTPTQSAPSEVVQKALEGFEIGRAHV